MSKIADRKNYVFHERIFTPGNRIVKNLDFDAKMGQNVSLPVWVRVSMIGTVVRRTTERFNQTYLLFFNISQVQAPKTTFLMLHAHFRSKGCGDRGSDD